jgi:pyruvate dehydrogenase (quinone)
MQMNGINGLITIAERWRGWGNPTLVVLVLNNRDLNFVTFEQRGMEANPKYPASQDLPDFPYADYARMLGLHGIRVERDDQAAAAWDQALSCGKPCLLEIMADAAIPPLPPHIPRMQAKSYFEAFKKGDPDADAVGKAAKQQGADDSKPPAPPG